MIKGNKTSLIRKDNLLWYHARRGVLTLVKMNGKLLDERENLSFNIEKRVTVIGSSVDADFVIDDSTVSRRHCEIELLPEGYLIRDLNSKNGTYLNGIRIKEGYLSPGVNIEIGNSKIVFSLEKKGIDIAISEETSFGSLYGKSVAMREIFGILQKISQKDVTVLIEGESGTGKEVIAREIHNHSLRKDKPFIVFDCGAVPKDLIESELFGHVKGAFTSAVSDRKGAFLLANGGTLFLDEIGELDISLQPKLLRVLENREVKPVGSSRVYKVDVRIIAATNRNLKDEILKGNFREDLYFRLAVIKIKVPPLRERREDIPLLVDHFMEEACAQYGKPKLKVSYELMEKLKSLPWKGNVRELKNAIHRAVVLSDEEDAIESDFLSQTVVSSLPQKFNTNSLEAKEISENIFAVSFDTNTPFKLAKEKLLFNFEVTYLKKLLEKSGGNITKAAKISGMHRKSIEYLVKKYEEYFK